MTELHSHHTAMIDGSAISSAVAGARGYYTATSKSELTRLGFARNQQSVPALVIPQYSLTGERCGYQIRPDDPRVIDGKSIKYETPRGARLHVDVPPGARAQLGDPSIDLYVTEGSRKADSAVSRGLCCVSLSGVYGWRGTANDAGGKMALPDWESIALNGRRVWLAFDSDVVRKKEVRGALDRLRRFLESRAATVGLIVFPEDGEAKVGMDDFFASGRTVADLESLRAQSIPSEMRATLQPPLWAGGDSILKGVVSTVARLGCTGEEKAVQLLYLAIVSRLLAPPQPIVSVVVNGPSAGGKSHLVEKVLALFPEEAVYALSAMSEHSLAYSEVDFSHRMLVLYESAALTSDFGTYLIRSLLSEGRIRYETVEKTPEGLRARLIEREGPTGLITTTTQAALHPENQTRMLAVTINDSREQTKLVMSAIATRGTAHGPDLDDWHALQGYLAADGPYVVDVPFAAVLADEIPPVAVRLRRDFSTLLSLVRAHAVLHRQSRQIVQGRVQATLEDYAAVRELVADSIAQAVDATVSATLRATVGAVRKLVDGPVKTESITVARLASELKLDKSATWRRARVSISNGYLANLETGRGRPARLVLGDPLPEDVELLPSVEKLRQACEGCTVAGVREGIGCARTTEPTSPLPSDRRVAYLDDLAGALA